MKGRAALLPWLALLTLYVVWGSTYLAIRVAVQQMPPFATAALRFVLAGTAMARIAAWLDRGRGLPTFLERTFRHSRTRRTWVGGNGSGDLGS